MKERLQKILAARGVASRRKAEELITGGHVRVNGKIITTLGTQIEDSAEIMVDNKPVGSTELVYYLLYKPAGVVTTLSDPEGRPTVAKYFSKIPQRVFPVGRLDEDTSGLLLVTNDGTLANLVTHPRYEITKRYNVLVRGIITDQTLKRLENGLHFREGKIRGASVLRVAAQSKQKTSHIELEIHEGKNRQVRRMFGMLGYPVVSLERIQLGQLTLGEMKPGQIRPLTTREIQALKNQVKKPELGNV